MPPVYKRRCGEAPPRGNGAKGPCRQNKWIKHVLRTQGLPPENGSPLAPAMMMARIRSSSCPSRNIRARVLDGRPSLMNLII
jgi:hypothetical protein